MVVSFCDLTLSSKFVNLSGEFWLAYETILQLGIRIPLQLMMVFLAEFYLLPLIHNLYVFVNFVHWEMKGF